MVTQTETTQTQVANKAATAVLVDIKTGDRVNVAVRQELHGLIRQQMRTGEGLRSKLFRLARDCGDPGTFHGTIKAAEWDICQEEKVKNLNQLNKARDMALASYLTVRAALERAFSNAGDLAVAQQELWAWEADKEGKETKYLPKGYMDAFSDRYADPLKGPSLFWKDFQASSEAAPTLQQKRTAWERAQAKAREQAGEGSSGTAPGPDGGIRSGGGQSEIKLPADWQESLNGVKKTLVQLSQDKGFVKSTWAERVSKCLIQCDGALFQLLRDYNEELKTKSTEHSQRPSQAMADANKSKQAAPELPEVPTTAEAQPTEGDIPLSPEEEQYIKDHAPDDEAHGPENQTGTQG